MKYPVLLSAFIATLMIGGGAQAADTAELQVKGTIRPAACQALFPGNGVIDFGTIKQPDPQLKSRFFDLPPQKLQLKISCDGQTRIAVRASDNRPDSVKASNPLDARGQFGLGTYRGQRIGFYAVSFDSAIADGKETDVLVKPIGAAAWSPDTGRRLRRDGSQFTFGEGAVPIAFTEVSASLDIGAKLSREAYLLLVDDIRLDGSISIEMLYL